MKVQYLSPFAEAAMRVFEKVVGELPEQGLLGARSQMVTSQQFNVVCGVSGSMEGLVIYGMSAATADRIAAKMLGVESCAFDSMSASAVAELANMISGHSMTSLAAEGYRCEITPPTIIRGTNISVTSIALPSLVIPLEFPELGTFEIHVSLQETHRSAA